MKSMVADEMNGEGNGAGIDAIVNNLLEKAPSVSEHVIEHEQIKTVEQAGQYPGFDPAIHAVDGAGNPIPKMRRGAVIAGEWQRKRGKAASVAGGESSRTPGPSQLGNIATPPARDPGQIAAATAAAHLVFQTGLLIGGEDWQPIIDLKNGIHEPDAMRGAWLAYFEAEGITDFPPGVALSITLLAYALPRFTMPKTQSRFSQLKNAIKNFFSKKSKVEKTDEEK
jgi:hypothetical protein